MKKIKLSVVAPWGDNYDVVGYDCGSGLAVCQQPSRLRRTRWAVAEIATGRLHTGYDTRQQAAKAAKIIAGGLSTAVFPATYC